MAPGALITFPWGVRLLLRSISDLHDPSRKGNETKFVKTRSPPHSSTSMFDVLFEGCQSKSLMIPHGSKLMRFPSFSSSQSAKRPRGIGPKRLSVYSIWFDHLIQWTKHHYVINPRNFLGKISIPPSLFLDLNAPVKQAFFSGVSFRPITHGTTWVKVVSERRGCRINCLW